jgi:hypothetical protein
VTATGPVKAACRRRDLGQVNLTSPRSPNCDAQVRRYERSMGISKSQFKILRRASVLGTASFSARPCFCIRRLLLDGFDVDVERDIGTEAEVGHLGDAELGTAEGARCGEAGLDRVRVPRKRGFCVPGDVQDHRLGRAEQGQVARDLGRLVTGLFDGRALERDLRKLLGIQEVRALQGPELRSEMARSPARAGPMMSSSAFADCTAYTG